MFAEQKPAGAGAEISSGIGHFIVVLGEREECERLGERMQRLRPDVAGWQMPPSVRPLGSGADAGGIAAVWGGAVVDEAPHSIVIGLFQKMRRNRPGVGPATLRQMFDAAYGTTPPDAAALGGTNFSAVVVQPHERRAVALTDPFRRLPLYRAAGGGCTAFATDARLLVDLGIVPREIDVQSLYHYLNFSCVPAPYCIFKRVRKVPAGTYVRAMPGTTIEEPYWRPRYPEDHEKPVAALEDEFRDMLYATVRAYRPPNGTRWGTFLSGGTDSSSIAGILATEEGSAPVTTFSIGFDETGYDELEFAHIAATHFHTDARYHKVNAMDALAAIPKLLRAFDEPYGNASAIPTFHCAAAAAAEGMQLLLAGDGGDENFGGNERYAKDAVYQLYARLPAALRASMATMLSASERSGGLLVNRIRNFARRGARDNPERFYMDDSFASECYERLLTPALQAALQKESSLAVVRRHYQDANTASELHRLMYIDLMMAIADNDITKVHRSSHAAGVSVAYPYLDVDLVRFAGRLRAHWKVNGMRKRYLFKRALRDLLPEAILFKKKQGFALPIAHWLRRPGKFRELLHDTLRSRHAAERGWFDAGFVAGLLDVHDRGSWDNSPELWRLFMLELWQREYVDGLT